MIHDEEGDVQESQGEAIDENPPLEISDEQKEQYSLEQPSPTP